MITLKSIASIIKKSKNVAILGHVSPDLDCLGSAFSLKEALTKYLNKNVCVFADGKIQEGDSKIFLPNRLEEKEFMADEYDLLIVVDTPNETRIGKYANEVSKHKNIVRIDHHFDPSNELTKNFYLDEHSSSCSELVYELLTYLIDKFDSVIATYIYAGIIGDTGSFKNSNTTPNSLEIASKMCKEGADIIGVSLKHFSTKTKNDWQLSKLVHDKAEFYKNFAIIGLCLKDLNKVGVSGEGVSFFANEVIEINGIKLGCIFTERNLKTFHCSFRSILGIPANKVAEKLGGGGHPCAAACVLTGSYKEVRLKILNAIKDVFESEGIQ